VVPVLFLHTNIGGVPDVDDAVRVGGGNPGTVLGNSDHGDLTGVLLLFLDQAEVVFVVHGQLSLLVSNPELFRVLGSRDRGGVIRGLVGRDLAEVGGAEKNDVSCVKQDS